MLNGCNFLPGAEFYVAVDNKGLWPNLTLLPNGEIAAAVYNHPSHGLGYGDVELWVSADGGRSWSFRSSVSDHSGNPKNNRMNHAVGLNARGELVVLVSGYTDGPKLPKLPVQRCISADNGATWEREIIDIPDVPFGDIICLPDETLACSMYDVERDPSGRKSKTFRCAVLVSKDHGRTWTRYSEVGPHSETFILRLRNGTWLAAARTKTPDPRDAMLPHGNGTLLLRSTDEGKTWDDVMMVSPKGQENAHLLELADGRLLLSLTSRIPGLFGVAIRVSEDGGESWSPTGRVLISIPATNWYETDSGYPSSVQLEDGTIVTAYYFGPRYPKFAHATTPWHQRYHMGVARWRLESTD